MVGHLKQNICGPRKIIKVHRALEVPVSVVLRTSGTTFTPGHHGPTSVGVARERDKEQY